MIDFSISDNTPLHLPSLKRIVCDLNDTGAELRMPAMPCELSIKKGALAAPSSLTLHGNW
ncbi:MAG: hypothetical protein SVE93_03280 [Candidatus Thermoplasmatota archaeon]|nr:hypothetical protein [Candidatus Thermoplasmatota archaeon]